MESEPVLMEIHLSEARLTNGIKNDGDIIHAGSRTICHAESSIITTGGETLQNIHTKLDTCGSVSIAHSSYLTQVKRAKEHGLPQIRLTLSPTVVTTFGAFGVGYALVSHPHLL
jgi:hypothetical protein